MPTSFNYVSFVKEKEKKLKNLTDLDFWIIILNCIVSASSHAHYHVYFCICNCLKFCLHWYKMNLVYISIFYCNYWQIFFSLSNFLLWFCCDYKYVLQLMYVFVNIKEMISFGSIFLKYPNKKLWDQLSVIIIKNHHLLSFIITLSLSLSLFFLY